MINPLSPQTGECPTIRFGNIDYEAGPNGKIDCTKYSLLDFSHGDQVDNMLIPDRIASMASVMDDCFDNQFFQYRRQSLSGSAPVMRVKDQYTGESVDMVNLASNDYLNLTKHPRVLAAARAALEEYGTGAGSVLLLGGTSVLHRELELAIARFKGCEDSILFTSGFGSNYGFLSTILRKQDIAILDMFAHASLVDGCRNTNHLFFLHNNMDSLEKILRRCEL